jgi:hypothetical protein
MFLAIQILLMQAAANAATSSARTLSVCDVLADDPTRLNGQVLSVRGMVEATEEGSWLIGTCKTHLVTKGLTWANIIWIYVDHADEDAEHSWGTISTKASQLHADLRRDKIWVTIVGRLETRKSMEDAVYQMPYGPSKVGFGHLGAAPAEIDVISVRDVTIVPPQHNAKPASRK